MNVAESTIVHKLSTDEQAEWFAEAREIIRAAPPVQFRTPNGMPMSVRVTNAGALGWISDRMGYRYVPISPHGKPWPPIPRRWVEFADRVAGREPWDACVLNFYKRGTKLGAHVDKSEHPKARRRPVVTVMLGDPAIWAVEDSAGVWHRTRVGSGFVTMLEGPRRSAKHAIEAILEPPPADLFARPESPLVDREGRAVPGRISISMRVAGDPAWPSPEPGDEPSERDSSGLNWERDEQVERVHHCHAIGCATACPPEFLMCPRHWRKVPKTVQSAVWRAYRPGQCDDMNPSEAWHVAADRAIALVAVAEQQWTREQADAWLARRAR